MFHAGQNIVQDLKDGMTSKIGILGRVAGLTASAAGSAAPSLVSGVSTGGAYNQQIIINTQELNPRRQAAELGWLLAGRA